MGMPNRNTMVVPCMVKSRLNVSGGTMCRPGHASCRRIRVASSPATTTNISAVRTYMIPRRLWSTVTTQSCNSSRSVRGDALASGPAIDREITLMIVASLEGDQVRGERFQLLPRDLHGRHERSDLQCGGILHPGVEILARVSGPPPPQCSAGPQVP